MAFAPFDFIARLAALVPRPRTHLTLPRESGHPRWRGAPGCPHALTRELVESWVASAGPIQPRTRAQRLQVMRLLGRFLSLTHPETYIPGPAFGPRLDSGFRPHIYTPVELDSLLAAAAQLGPRGSLRPKTVVALLGLLYCTGLRISEALALRLATSTSPSGSSGFERASSTRRVRFPFRTTSPPRLLRTARRAPPMVTTRERRPPSSSTSTDARARTRLSVRPFLQCRGVPGSGALRALADRASTTCAIPSRVPAAGLVPRRRQRAGTPALAHRLPRTRLARLDPGLPRDHR